MGLPEEDRGPAWLRDWGRETGHTDLNSFTGYVDPHALAVELTSLLDFANSLQAEHELDFRPHARTVFDQMSAAPAQPDGRFVELSESMIHHRDMLVLTSTEMAQHDRAIIAFVEAARAITDEYRGADARAAARAVDVEANLSVPIASTVPATTTTDTTTTSTTSQDGLVTPEQAAAQTATPISDTPQGTSPDNGTEYQP